MASGGSGLEGLRPLILAATFMIFATMMAAMAGPILMNGDGDNPTAQTDLYDHFDPSFLAQNTVWDTPMSIAAADSDWAYYNMSAQYFSSYVDISHGVIYDGDYMRFSKPASTDAKDKVYVVLVTGNTRYGDPTAEEMGKYHDFIFLYKSWGWWDFQYQVVSLQALDNLWNEKTREIHIPLTMEGKGMLIIQTADDGTEIATAWDFETGATFWVSQSLMDAVDSSLNGWNIIGGLLTFQMPLTGTWIDFLITIPMYICLLYVAYKIILMAIPFVGG